MKKSLLIVDDDRSVCESLRKLLEAEGFEVHLAGDAGSAIKHLNTTRIDLVVLDINLGNDNGWEVFESMAKSKPFVPAIVITAEWGQRDRAVALGAEALIEKPIDVVSFLEMIDSLLSKSAEHRLRRIPGSENYCRYLAKDYATFLKLLQERRSAPFDLSSEMRAALPKSLHRRDNSVTSVKSSVVGAPSENKA